MNTASPNTVSQSRSGACVLAKASQSPSRGRSRSKPLSTATFSSAGVVAGCGPSSSRSSRATRRSRSPRGCGIRPTGCWPRIVAGQRRAPVEAVVDSGALVTLLARALLTRGFITSLVMNLGPPRSVLEVEEPGVPRVRDREAPSDRGLEADRQRLEHLLAVSGRGPALLHDLHELATDAPAREPHLAVDGADDASARRVHRTQARSRGARHRRSLFPRPPSGSSASSCA